MPITPVKQLVAAAKAEINTLSREDAARQVTADEAVFVDIRDVCELQREGRIKGAATDKTLILFCASAWRSALAAKALQDMGVRAVSEMEGGFKGWIADRRPVLRDEPRQRS